MKNASQKCSFNFILRVKIYLCVVRPHPTSRSAGPARNNQFQKKIEIRRATREKVGLNTIISYYPGYPRVKRSNYSKFSKNLSKNSKKKMSVSELPTASAVSTDDSETISGPSMEIDVPTLIAAAKHFDSPDLFKIIGTLLKQAEKQSKTVGKSTSKRGTVKKDAPKGKTPRQLRKNNAWVTFTLENAREHGWESFIVKSSRKDKETSEVTEEEIEMPASELHDGCYVYEGSVTESTPAGRQIIHKEAMSLSKARKESHPSWEKFLESYEEEAASETESVAAKSTASSKVTVRKTAAEKAEEKAVKEKAAAEEKERKAKEREAKKAETAAKKQAERDAVEARKAERAEAKAAKEKAVKEEKERKEAEKTSKVKKTVVKATPVKAATVVAAPKPAAAPVAVKAAGGAGAKRPVVEDDWTPPMEEGACKSWSFKGKTYFRNAENEIWLKKSNGSVGDWQGVYLPAEGRIDDSVPEPCYDEE